MPSSSSSLNLSFNTSKFKSAKGGFEAKKRRLGFYRENIGAYSAFFF